MEIEEKTQDARNRLAEFNWNELVPLSTRFYCALKLVDGQIKELTNIKEFFGNQQIFENRIKYLNEVRDELFNIMK